MANAIAADHVYVIVTKHWKGFIPGVCEYPIGMAYEAIKNGFAKIDPRSQEEFSKFQKLADKRK